MDDALLNFLRDLMEMRDAHVERLAPQITFAAGLAANCLAKDGRIFSLGCDHSAHIASILEQQLIDQYRIERPSLPCIGLQPCQSNQSSTVFSTQQLRALAKHDDCLIIFSSLAEESSASALLDIASDRGMTSILIGPTSASKLRSKLQDNDLDIAIDVTHKAQLLDSQLSIALSIAGLIDFQLFGSDM